jgi:histone H3/H4
MSNNNNVINVNKLVHENAITHNNEKYARKEKFQVSPAAIYEYVSRIIDHITDNTPYIAEIAQKHGRKTIMEQDVIEFFGFVESEVA